MPRTLASTDALWEGPATLKGDSAGWIFSVVLGQRSIMRNRAADGADHGYLGILEMMETISFAQTRRAALVMLGLGALACSVRHDCWEARDCSGPKGFIEGGPSDDWLDPSGTAGEAELGVPGPPLVVVGSAGDAADGDASGGDAGTASIALDALPRVVAVTPTDGATGVRSDAKLTIAFNQAMDEASLETAYQSNDLPAARVVFSWNDAFTSLTVTPSTPLDYASGAAESDGSVAFPAKTYHFAFDGSARDRAGRALSAVSFSFHTLRQASFEMAADPTRTGNWTDGEGEGIHDCLRSAKVPYVPTVCVGDDANNVRYTGFLSFDLSRFPAGIAGFSNSRLEASALVYGTPENLGESQLDRVSFDRLEDALANALPIAKLGSFYSAGKLSSGAELTLNEDLTSALADDYLNRGARSNRSQYRLSFERVVADGAWDDLELPTSDIRLLTTYLIP
jgi:hypothetical protein